MRNDPVPGLSLAAVTAGRDVPFLHSLLRFSEPIAGSSSPYRVVDVAAIKDRSEIIRSYGWDVTEDVCLRSLPVTGTVTRPTDLVLALSNAELGGCPDETAHSLVDFSRNVLRRGGLLMAQMRQHAPLDSTRFIAICRSRGFLAAWRASPLFPADPFHGEHHGPTDLVIARQDMPSPRSVDPQLPG